MAIRQKKRHSTSLTTKEMEIKTTARQRLIAVRMAIIKKSTKKKDAGVGEEKPFYTVGGNVIWYSH